MGTTIYGMTVKYLKSVIDGFENRLVSPRLPHNERRPEVLFCGLEPSRPYHELFHIFSLKKSEFLSPPLITRRFIQTPNRFANCALKHLKAKDLPFREVFYSI